MRKFQCLLFVLKQSYICYYIICMTVPLNEQKMIFLTEGMYSHGDTVWKLKYSKKLSRRNGSLENLIKEPFLLRPMGLWQHSKFTSTIGKCQGISTFFSVCLGKKNAEAIKCLIRTLKKYAAKNKIYFCFKKKCSLNKKVIFVFHTIFNIYYIIHRCL